VPMWMSLMTMVLDVPPSRGGGSPGSSRTHHQPAGCGRARFSVRGVVGCSLEPEVPPGGFIAIAVESSNDAEAAHEEQRQLAIERAAATSPS
jgi:hypothetical protein